jgi:molybdate transport system substrate-binding protein
LINRPNRRAARLRVSAAVSLTDALTPIARKWEGAGNIHVELNFAASNVLARQILEGAPVTCSSAPTKRR